MKNFSLSSLSLCLSPSLWPTLLTVAVKKVMESEIESRERRTQPRTAVEEKAM
jgi:hypothetical protein